MIKSILKRSYRLFRNTLCRIRDPILSNEMLYRSYLRLRYGAKLPPNSLPNWPATSGVLKSSSEWRQALAQVRALSLPRHPDLPKSWDTLSALTQILSETNTDGKV